VQSFDDARLAAIGRVHGGDEARRALEAAIAIFATVNADLMYALPGQDLEGAMRDVQEAIAFAVPHISAYHLTLEPDTHFHRFPPQLPDEDASADMQDAIEHELAQAGYGHYETSAFAKPGRQARHNLNYWTFGDYLGIGAGAHAKISFRDRIVREQRERKPATYLRAAMESRAIAETREVEEAELAFEFMLNALRLVEGFPLELFTMRTGLPANVVTPELDRASTEGLVERDHARVRPTAKGRRFLNDLMQRFLPARAPRKRTIPISTSSPGTSRPS
jgi:oxygen-independent coproporphyrinogen-3 oxidase